ncbi:MAG: T9SS type A sorting domain-containing protein, partial [Saprospiraceae bacterium]|nr:T9SS type A sorting domain-containing protein [Saprospiraceae bacterium]
LQIVLKHQPDIKSATSGIDDGGTDVDITWTVNIVDDPDAPPCENEEEVIDRVTLTFTPTSGGDTIVAVASDPDGPGPLDLEVEDITLEDSTEYQLSITLENTIEGEDITEEIMAEDDEHQFFFGWTDGAFVDPLGDGNLDVGSDPVNYLDADDNGLPVGLLTRWTTSSDVAGTFRLVLKHQPDVKSAMSTSEDGSTDLDITWNLNSTTTNVFESQQRTISIAPNPVADRLRILSRESIPDDAIWSVYNSMGQLVKHLARPASVIEVSDLAPGTYTMVVWASKYAARVRFTKL